MSSMKRTMLRNRAKARMKAKGMRKIFKYGFFAANWREFAK